MTPNRHHCTGRPLPRPPPSLMCSNIAPTFAPEVSVYIGDTEGRSSPRCPEGSDASTPLSDGARLRSQLHLTITPPSSAAELIMESGSQGSALFDSTIRGGSSPISDINRPFEPTELDLLVSRIAYGEEDASDYEVSSGHPGWPPSLNNSPDPAPGLRVNWTGKPDPCRQSSSLAASQHQCQHFTHWANRGQM